MMTRRPPWWPPRCVSPPGVRAGEEHRDPSAFRSSTRRIDMAAAPMASPRQQVVIGSITTFAAPELRDLAVQVARCISRPTGWAAGVDPSRPAPPTAQVHAHRAHVADGLAPAPPRRRSTGTLPAPAGGRSDVAATLVLPEPAVPDTSTLLPRYSPPPSISSSPGTPMGTAGEGSWVRPREVTGKT